MFGMQAKAVSAAAMGAGVTGDQIKELQRNDPAAKQQWIAYTDLHGGGFRDPNRHDAAFLEQFMQSFNSGVVLPTEVDDNNTGVLFKLMQKRSAPWRAAWEKYCDAHPENGDRKHDPTKHGSNFHLAFLDHISQAVQASGGLAGPHGNVNPMQQMMGMGGGFDGPPAKKQNVSSGDPMKDKMAAAIKAYQKGGEEQKAHWGSFCDAMPGGWRDPARHENAILMQFIKTYGVSMDVALPTFSGGGGGLAGSDPTKDALVQRIKAFRKMGAAQEESWASACGRTKDPARHEVSALQDFVNTYGVPDLASRY